MDESINKAKEIFKDYLKTKQLKVTKEREKILIAVFETHEHFNAEELLEGFKNDEISVSRATIYRTLDLLVECKLIKKMNFGETQFRYEHVLGHSHHDHLICKSCGKIIEFYCEELEQLQTKICNENQFKETEHSLRIFGLCSDCQ